MFIIYNILCLGVIANVKAVWKAGCIDYKILSCNDAGLFHGRFYSKRLFISVEFRQGKLIKKRCRFIVEIKLIGACASPGTQCGNIS